MKNLSSDYYHQDSLYIARDLLGKVLESKIGGVKTSGRIVETEAYLAPKDKGSHAYGGKQTKRTATMYLPGGHTYIYLCYGIHHLFNVVTAQKGTPHAILIRALEPLQGLDSMRDRRQQQDLKNLCNGPGKLSQALGITRAYDAVNLTARNSPIHIVDEGTSYKTKEVISSPRVGIAYAAEWAHRPWRFRVKDSCYTSLPAVVNYDRH